MNGNVLDLILVNALDPNTCFRDTCYWRRGKEDEEKEERTGKAYERYEAHQ